MLMIAKEMVANRGGQSNEWLEWCLSYIAEGCTI
jgi:hypothetical protein